MRRTAENGALAIAHQHEIGGIDRQLDAFAEGVAGIELDREAFLFGAFDRLLACSQCCDFAPEFGESRNLRFECADERMVSRERAEARPEYRVVSRRIDRELFIERTPTLVLEREGEAHAF